MIIFLSQFINQIIFYCVSACRERIPDVKSSNRSSSVGEQVIFQCTVEFPCYSPILSVILRRHGVYWRRNGSRISNDDIRMNYTVNIR